MIVLDTNVLSAALRRETDETLTAWLDNRPFPIFWLTAVTVFGIRFGIELLPNGRRRRELEAEFARVLAEDFQNRVLPLDEMAAQTAAAIGAQRRRAGRPMEIRDTLIAGIVMTQRAELATRNTRHFTGLNLRLLNPWED